VSLVTKSSKGRSLAREEGEHAVVLALMHGGEDEDELLVVLLTKGYVGRFLVVDWAAVGLLCRLCCWACLGYVGLVRSGRPGKSISFLLFCFSFFCF
jgi:hypothetical protein